MEETEGEERRLLLERFGRRHREGEIVYREGDPASRCFLIEFGTIRLVRDHRGRERTVEVVRRGDLLGEDALYPPSLRVATAMAMTDVELLALDVPTFERLVGGSPPIGRRLLGQLARRIRDADERLELSLLRDAPSRVAVALGRAARRRHDVGDAPLDLTPIELATSTGLDLDTVKRTVLALRDGGYVAIDDEKIVVRELDALDTLVEILAAKEAVRDGS